MLQPSPDIGPGGYRKNTTCDDCASTQRFPSVASRCAAPLRTASMVRTFPHVPLPSGTFHHSMQALRRAITTTAKPVRQAKIPRRHLSDAHKSPSASAAPGATTNKPAGGPVTWRSLAVATGVAAGIGTVYYYYKEERLERLKARARNELPAGGVGRPAIGGPFTLVDSRTERTVTDRDFAGQHMLVYFGVAPAGQAIGARAGESAAGAYLHIGGPGAGHAAGGGALLARQRVRRPLRGAHRQYGAVRGGGTRIPRLLHQDRRRHRGLPGGPQHHHLPDGPRRAAGVVLRQECGCRSRSQQGRAGTAVRELSVGPARRPVPCAESKAWERDRDAVKRCVWILP
eukprot:ctg_129.g99